MNEGKRFGLQSSTPSFQQNLNPFHPIKHYFPKISSPQNTTRSTLTRDSIILEEIQLQLLINILSRCAHGHKSQAQTGSMPYSVCGGFPGLFQQVVADPATMIGVDEAWKAKGW